MTHVDTIIEAERAAQKATDAAAEEAKEKIAAAEHARTERTARLHKDLQKELEEKIARQDDLFKKVEEEMRTAHAREMEQLAQKIRERHGRAVDAVLAAFMS